MNKWTKNAILVTTNYNHDYDGEHQCYIFMKMDNYKAVKKTSQFCRKKLTNGHRYEETLTLLCISFTTTTTVRR